VSSVKSAQGGRRVHSPPPSRIDPNALEQGVLGRWEREKTFEESLRRRRGGPRYSFYDGPPYATGSPHYGHVLQATIKDAVTRYWTMRGFLVDRRVGWDCHGLPVENLVEKELGIKNKKEIETMGIEKFNAACRASVFRSVDEFQSVLQRMGRWADYRNSYATLDPTYMESVWWVFKQAWEAGLVYNGFRSSPYCPRCATPLSNFEAALGYKETDDPAVTVKLRLADADSTYLLIWTTTPWTLPANVAVAVHPDLRYVQVKVGDEHWILAKDRVADVVGTGYTMREEYAGSQLVGMTYEPLYDFLVPEKAAYRVVAATFVSATEGTGIVHLAPAFGEDDLKTAQTENLPILRTVDENGTFIQGVKPWAGMFVKDADPNILKDLEGRNLLLRSETIRHPYPFCWRCDTPLIYYATNSWFVSVSRIRDRLLANNEQIQWVPEHVKGGRFGQGLKDAPDWAISRSRYWGTPVPVWECSDCGERTVIGSIAELEKNADLTPLYPNGKGKLMDLHRPYIDAVTFPCPKCGKPVQRIPEVFDVWMDAGSMPYAQWHYPFENKALVEETFPADFIAEALDQTRGWFYTLHVLATILTTRDIGLGVGKPAFTHAIVSGLVLAEDGKKLSKRLKNYTDVTEIVRRFGADTLRLYLLSSASIGEDTRISDRLIEGFYRKFTLPLFNVLSFYDMYAKAAGRKPGSSALPLSNRPLLDQWILARAVQLAARVRGEMESYHVDRGARELLPFVDDLSNWYVRRSRKRFSATEHTTDQTAAFVTLEEVLAQFALVAAPLTPFFSEVIFRSVREDRSPHLEDFPEVAEVNTGLLDKMATLRRIVSAGLQARAQAGIKVRQPLPEFNLQENPSFDFIKEPGWRDLLAGEVNVQKVHVGENIHVGEYVRVEITPGVSGQLATALDEGLMHQGIIRDLIRHVQELRKRAGLTVQDTIELAITTDDLAVQEAVRQCEQLLLAETRAKKLAKTLSRVEGTEQVTIHGHPVTLGLRRV